MDQGGGSSRGKNRCTDCRRDNRNVRCHQRGQLAGCRFRFGSGGDTFPADLGCGASRSGRITIKKMRRGFSCRILNYIRALL